MIDFNYTAPELLPFRIQEVLDAPNEPHRIGGVVYVPVTWQRSRWNELFGTPERAARTLYYDKQPICAGCALLDECEKTPDEEQDTCLLIDYDALLEWLRGDVE